MFEEDVPSVLELEMEELDQWMQQDGRYQSNKKNHTLAGPIWKATFSSILTSFTCLLLQFCK